jgi:EmrB/QacA subfamily drug resistance transporter
MIGLSASSGTRQKDPNRMRWWALAVIDLCLLVVTLDNTILNVALPTISRQLGATGSQLQWMVDAYIVVFAGLLLTSGTIGDRLGRRRLLLSGLSIIALASTATAFVSTADQLIVIRGLMGLGGALLMPATLSIITNLFDDTERPKAIATWAAVAGMGMVLGPIAGGALLEAFSWNAVFLFNVPVALVGIVGIAHLVPESRDEHPGKLDPIGSILSIVGVATLVFGIIEAPGAGWGSTETLIRIGAGVVVLATFVAWETYTREPMFDLRLFTNPAFGAASFAETVAHFALVGATFGLTQYLQFVWGQRPLEAGFAMLPIAVGVLVGSIVSSRLLSRIGPKFLLSGGMAALSVSLWLISRLAVDTPYPVFATMLLVMSLGMGLAMAPATESIMGAVSKARAGVGSATNDTTRELGAALGVAVLGSALSSGYRDAMTEKLAAMPGGLESLPAGLGAAIRDSLGSATAAASGLAGGQGASLLAAARESFVAGMSSAAEIGAVIVALGAVIALVWLPGRASEASAKSRFERESEPVAIAGEGMASQRRRHGIGRRSVGAGRLPFRVDRHGRARPLLAPPRPEVRVAPVPAVPSGIRPRLRLSAA